jgi:hypothetical protein
MPNPHVLERLEGIQAILNGVHRAGGHERGDTKGDWHGSRAQGRNRGKARTEGRACAEPRRRGQTAEVGAHPGLYFVPSPPG